MATAARRVRGADGTEHILVDVVEFEALVDAANAASGGMPDVGPIVERLGRVLELDEPTVELEQFLREYDAVHGSS